MPDTDPAKPHPESDDPTADIVSPKPPPPPPPDELYKTPGNDPQPEPMST